MSVDPPDDVDHARAVLAVLRRVDADLSASLDGDDALRRVVAAVVPALADWCAVDLVEGEPVVVEPVVVEPVDGAGRPAEDPAGNTGDDHGNLAGNPVDDPAGDPADRDAPDVVGEIERRRVRTAVAHTDPAKQALLWRMAELDAARPGASVVPRSIAGGRSVLLTDLTPDLLAARTAGSPELAGLFAALDNRAGAVVPLVVRGHVVGALTVSTTGDSGRPFGARELDLVEAVAARAALAVDNARLFAAEAAERRRAAALAEAGIALSSSLRRRDVLETLLSLTVPASADYAFVTVPRGDLLRPAAARDTGSERQAALETVLNGLEMRRGRPGPGAAWATGRTQVHRDVATAVSAGSLAEAPMARAVVRALGTTTSVHVPLVVRGECLGVLSLGRRGGAPFSDAEARHLTELGRRAALALANADAYERQRATATDLQRALLPAALPVVPGIQVAARYLPGDAGALVGGDWYDVVPLGDGRAALCVGDVMGRGTAAAALMGQLRAALRAFAAQDLPPREVLGRLAAFAAGLGPDGFATCLYAVHDPVAGTVTVASAGHPPPLRVRAAAGRADAVQLVPGPPLGVGTPDHYADTTLLLDAGDCLLLFTDGLVEDRDLAVDEGLERLAEGLGAARPATAEAACAAALRVMGRDRSHDDDTAVLAVRTLAPARRTTDGDAPRELRIRLSARPQAAATARRHVTGALACWGLADTAETAALVVSELVANAVRHGHGPIDLVVRAGAEGVELHVGDASAVPPAPRRATGPAHVCRHRAGTPHVHPEPLEDHGRGLLIVEALADAWGWTPRGDAGKDVWVRLRPAAVPTA